MIQRESTASRPPKGEKKFRKRAISPSKSRVKPARHPTGHERSKPIEKQHLLRKGLITHVGPLKVPNCNAQVGKRKISKRAVLKSQSTCHFL